MPDFFAADSWESGLSNSVALCEAHRLSIAFRLAEMNDHLSKTERIASPKRQVSSCKIVTILFYLHLFTKMVSCFQKKAKTKSEVLGVAAGRRPAGEFFEFPSLKSHSKHRSGPLFWYWLNPVLAVDRRPTMGIPFVN